MGALSIIRTDFGSRAGNKYFSNHPSNPIAFKLPSKIIGAVKSFFLFLLPAPKFSLFFLFPVLFPLIPIQINLTIDDFGNNISRVEKMSGGKMSGVYHLEIIETQDELKKRLRNEKMAFAKERLQALYLLKTKKPKPSKKWPKCWGEIESLSKIG
jgi:hypothetical protein